ncbi:MAG: hypothetical protein ABWY20_02290 [Mycobacterium sp.]
MILSLTVPNNHPDYRTLRYGWRWYWVRQGILVSPIEELPLPYNGVLDDVHTIPLAELMWHALQGYWLDFSPDDIQEKGFALTFGRVYGPFSPDNNINCMFGSTRVARYASEVICSEQVIDGSYGMPVARGVDLSTLQAVELDI